MRKKFTVADLRIHHNEVLTALDLDIDNAKIALNVIKFLEFFFNTPKNNEYKITFEGKHETQNGVSFFIDSQEKSVSKEIYESLLNSQFGVDI